MHSGLPIQYLERNSLVYAAAAMLNAIEIQVSVRICSTLLSLYIYIYIYIYVCIYNIIYQNSNEHRILLTTNYYANTIFGIVNIVVQRYPDYPILHPKLNAFLVTAQAHYNG